MTVSETLLTFVKFKQDDSLSDTIVLFLNINRMILATMCYIYISSKIYLHTAVVILL